MKFLPIQGTHGWRERGQWWMPDSPFMANMNRLGHSHVAPEDPFVWSTDLNGASLWRLFGKRAKHRDWHAGGKALAWYLRDVPYADRNLIAHSHGLQVALFAATVGDIYIRSLVSVASPERADMDEVAVNALCSIGRWVHVIDARADWLAWLGQMTDGRWFGSRRCCHANVNIELPGVGHSGLLVDEKHFHYWPEQILPALETSR
jgi:hypothetical protein